MLNRLEAADVSRHITSELTVESVLCNILKASADSAKNPSHTSTQKNIKGVCLRSIRPCWTGTWTDKTKNVLVDIMAVCMKRVFLCESLYVSEQGRYNLTGLGLRALKKRQFDLIDHNEVLIAPEPKKNSRDDNTLIECMGCTSSILRELDADIVIGSIESRRTDCWW